jgi:hypothetical protein
MLTLKEIRARVTSCRLGDIFAIREVWCLKFFVHTEGTIMRRTVSIAAVGIMSSVMSFETLAKYGFPDWESASAGAVPARAVPLGREADGVPLYGCRGELDGVTVAGKIRTGFGGCNVARNGKEVTIRNYEVIVNLGEAILVDRAKLGSSNQAIDVARRGASIVMCAVWQPDKAVHLGWASMGQGKCHYGWGGQERIAERFAVLIHKDEVRR